MWNTIPPSGTLLAYADRLSAFPGEELAIHASSSAGAVELDVVRLFCGDEAPDGPGARSEPVAVAGAGTHPAALQPVVCGSWATLPLEPAAAWPSCTVSLWLWPTLPAAGHRQVLLTRPGHLTLLLDADGALVLEVGGVAGPRIAPGPRERRWAHVVATVDAAAGRAALHLTSAAWPAQDAHAEAAVTVPGTPPSGGLMLAAAAPGTDPFNGKLEAPEVRASADGDPVAAWDLAAGAPGRAVADVTGAGRDGAIHGLPVRPATGHAFTGAVDDPALAPAEFAACHFHEDDLEDCGWPETARLTLPADLPSGVYGARLRAGDLEDVVPFFVRAARGAEAGVAFLVPTVSYGAYANERMQDRPFVHEPGVLGMPITPDRGDLLLRDHPELAASLYDSHRDGAGRCYSSFRRPVLNMRPWHRNWQTRAPRALSADLYVVDWLDREGVETDVLCDHDLHADGAGALAPYRVLITGCHPEYWTADMLDTLTAWLDGGGRLMYLGGNGFYWVTSIDPLRPHVVEVRRGVCGIRTWESQPGELRHGSTGEPGGLWRNRGRSPNALVGVGFAAQGFDDAAPGYRRLPASHDPRAAWVFDGVGADEVIGDFGLSMGGAAGDEIDRHDPRHGSPPEALVLATSQGGHSDYVLLVCEDVPVTHLNLGGTTCPDVRADMTLMPTARGGAVFSVGSIGWTAALAARGYDNNVATVTRNVLRRFLDPDPIDLQEATA